MAAGFRFNFWPSSRDLGNAGCLHKPEAFGYNSFTRAVLMQACLESKPFSWQICLLVADLGRAAEPLDTQSSFPLWELANLGSSLTLLGGPCRVFLGIKGFEMF